MNLSDPKLQQILVQIQQFGFKFYAFDESNIPLVIGPNNQITPINVAIDFVNRQIQTQRAQQSLASGGPENMPSAPQMPDATGALEKSVERGVETKNESNQEKKATKQNQQNDVSVNVPTKAPKVTLAAPIKPYGDGFDPKSFNPTDLKSTLDFISKNASAKKTSSNRWVAEQFKKFLEELKSTKV